MEPVTRFELAVDGEPQHVGFIVGLDDTGLPEHEKSRLASLFDEMPMPPAHAMQGGARSWFTEAGLARFSNAIAEVQRAYEDDGLFEVVATTSDAASVGDVIHHDEYQVIALSKGNAR